MCTSRRGWWKQGAAEHCAPEHASSCGPHVRAGQDAIEASGSPFGVKRPLRVLTEELELNEPQQNTLARILSELKTERAQAEVNRQRSLSLFSDLMAAPAFDRAAAEQALALRRQASEAVQAALLKALTELHALLDEKQRQRLAHLMRTGVVTM